MKKLISFLIAICIITNNIVYASALNYSIIDQNLGEAYEQEENNIEESQEENDQNISAEEKLVKELEENNISNDEEVESKELEEVNILNTLNEEISKFTFEASKNVGNISYDIDGYIDGTTIYCFLPEGVDVKKLVASYTTEYPVVKVNGKVQENGVSANNFTSTLKYELGTKSYEVKVIKSNIPVIQIETDGKQAIDSKEVYQNASMKINGSTQYSTGLYDGRIQIRGRGNSTWNLEKKPYRIKLDSKSDILGMGSAKDWVLLANYSDKTLIRNKLALELSKLFGLDYTSDSTYVDLIVNGEYLGNYLMCEQIEVGKTRVNISKLDENETSEDLITGGYLLEIDDRRDADTVFETNHNIPMSFKSPKNPNEAQKDYIVNYINELEDILYSSSFPNTEKHYSEYIDVDTFVNWYLINEIFKTNDAAFFSSIYLYKDRDEKLCIGPVWDFDIAAGNINYNGNDDPEGWYINKSGWYKQLFKDSEFVRKVELRFNELQSEIQSISNKIDSYSNELSISQYMNFTKWDILDKYVWPNAQVTGSYESEVNYLKTWLNKRIEWISNNIGSLTYKGSIESIANEEIVSKNVDISGWYLYDKDISDIEVLIDGNVIGKADRSSREDLSVKYPGYDISKAGYTYNLNTSSISNGEHTLEVRAKGSDGSSNSINLTIEVQNKVAPYKGNIESLTNKQTLSNTVNVNGWYIYGREISEIEILVDNKSQGSAKRSSRADVGVVYPGYNISKAGYSYNLDTMKLSNGNHKITVKAKGIDGTSHSTDITVNVSNNTSPYKGWVETLSDNAVISGKINLNGWYIYGKDINNIEILVDGKVKGVANRSSRPDVGAVYPSYNTSKAGYSYTLDTTTLSDGNHTISIKANGSDGSSDTLKYKVNVQNKVNTYKSWIEYPSNQLIVANDINISGWYIYGKEIEKIDILVDGNLEGTATRSSRPDVGGVYPEYNTSKAGFTYTLNTRKFANGKHTVEVRATGVDDSVNSTITTINIANENSMYKSWIESISNNQNVSGKVDIAGWYIYDKRIENVEILIDGEVKGKATRYSRPDVKEVYKSYNTSEAGFKYRLDTSNISNGKHTLEIRATSKDGTQNSTSITINVQNKRLPYKSWIESPSNYSIPMNGSIDEIAINGWYIYDRVISKIEILVDGELKGTAKRSAREDVGKAYPEYDSSKAGFSYMLDIRYLSKGNHVIEVRAKSDDGTTHSTKINIELVKLENKLWIDSPQGTVNNSDIKVQGWALNASGTKEVNIYIDNELKGSAKLGISRPDVNNAYPGYIDGSNSGYEFTINKNEIKPGKHTIKVESIAKNGSKTEKQITFELKKLEPKINIESPNGNIILNDRALEVTGWALNSSGVKSIKVYLDNKYVGNASIGIHRPDVNNVYPGYTDGSNSGFKFTLDTSSLGFASHKIEVEVIGNDGSVSYSETYIKDIRVLEYKKWDYSFSDHVSKQVSKQSDVKISDGKYIKASEDEIKYHMDYRNFTSVSDMYQFLRLDMYRDVESVSSVNDYLYNAIKKDSNNPLFNQGQAFIDAAKEYNLDPIYLIAHTFLETGYGTSALAKGYEVILDDNGNAIYYEKQIGNKTYKFVKIKDSNTPEGTKTVKVYNFFGIGAIDAAAKEGGVTTAYEKGWTTPYAAIKGAAKWISDGYINSTKYNQNTLYYMKWYYDTKNGNWHQYSTDIGWPNKIGSLMYKMSHLYNSDTAQMVYNLPEYISFNLLDLIKNILNI